MSIKHAQRRDKEIFMDEPAILQALAEMEKDLNLLTERGYTNQLFAEHELVSFSEKHMTYLRNHPKVNPKNYLSNLRTMTKIRT
jgi:hypothetical protein